MPVDVNSVVSFWSIQMTSCSIYAKQIFIEIMHKYSPVHAQISCKILYPRPPMSQSEHHLFTYLVKYTSMIKIVFLRILLSLKLHTLAPHMDVHCNNHMLTGPTIIFCTAHYPRRPTPSTKPTKKDLTYSFKACIAFLTTSAPIHKVSTLTSSTSSSCPTSPIFGFAVLPGLNCPIPIVVQQHSV
jgi:hypothetical protein